MPSYTLTSFANDTGAKTEIIDANKVNDNFSHCLAATPPIGSIVAHYDYNGSLTINADYWQYCRGQTVTITGIGSQTLPDLSNRYLVGFGTEGGGDLHTAAWATAAIGAASHLVDSSHTHTGPSHTHGAGTLKFAVAELIAGLYWKMYDTNGAGVTFEGGATGTSANSMGFSALNAQTFYTTSGTGATAAEGTGATGSGGSTTLAIQPRSVRVRWIIRVK